MDLPGFLVCCEKQTITPNHFHANGKKQKQNKWLGDFSQINIQKRLHSNCTQIPVTYTH